MKANNMTTSIKLNAKLKTQIQYLAHQQRRTSHWIMLEAITRYVKHETARENFKQEAIASWESYNETGLHLTREEVSSWLRTWGTEQEMEVPECHE